jgi:hypothetical protein
MTLSQALEVVKQTSEKMNAQYGATVFDEWAIVSLAPGQERLMAYTGPRKEHFQKNFSEDLGGFRAEVLTTRHTPGHFDFVRNGVGTVFEAFICAGDEVYVLCNNTQSSLEQIARNPRWLEAQKEFAAMTERFHVQPVNRA